VSGAISALLIGESGDLDARAVRIVLEHIAGRPATVTITGVAARLPLICNWAPVTGQVTVGQMKEISVARACEAARASAALFPEGVPVQHRAVRSWADGMRVAPEYDVLVVAGRPRRRRVAGLPRLAVIPAGRARLPRTALSPRCFWRAARTSCGRPGLAMWDALVDAVGPRAVLRAVAAAG